MWEVVNSGAIRVGVSTPLESSVEIAGEAPWEVEAR
jgi:hypothetical protein